MFDFMTSEEAADKWNVTPYQVRKLCQAGRVSEAVKKSGIWFLPSQAEHPDLKDKRLYLFHGTKKRVFETSVKLFAQRGFDAVTLKDIADTADLAQSAIYRHFKSKQEILDAIYDYFLHYYIADRPKITELDAVIKGGSPQEIFSSVIYDFSPEYRDILIDCTKIVVQRISIDDRAGELFRDLMLKSGLDYAECVYQRAIHAGTLPHADPFVLSVFSNMGRQTILLNWLANADPAMNEKMVQCMNTLSELMILGLTAYDRYDDKDHFK